MSEHVWAQENIAAYVAGGLEASEDERLEEHVADCAVCAGLVDEARSLEDRLAPLVLAADPGPALEDRIIQALPPVQATSRMNPLSGKRKALLAAAAAVLLAALGAGVSALIEQKGLGFPTASIYKMALAAHPRDLSKSEKEEFQKYAKSGGQVQKESVKWGAIGQTEGLRMGQVKGISEASLASADDLAKELRDNTLAPLMAESTPVETKNVKETSGKRADEIFAENVNKLITVNKAEGFHGWADLDGSVAKTANTTTSNPTPPPPSVPPTSDQPPVNATASGAGGVRGGVSAGGFGGPASGFGGGAAATPRAGGGRGFMPSFADQVGDKESKAEQGKVLVWNYANNGTLPNLGVNYFKPGEDQVRQRDDKHSDDKGLEGNYKGKLTEQTQKVQNQAPVQAATPAEPGSETQKANPPEAPPPAPRRIIIRTGDLEFEIDSFDASVAIILKLVNAAKGSFVATINSDKLPNGKVRGAVVVRIPPELLDNFVLDLRKELSKTGELKNQRIGSQDITKQYTDLESRLRAGRAMEQRLLAIIKDGKGQIKDLLAAEKELGVWRTQIESLEGELRYYGNQAAYSTLTIKLYEKNIRTAASVTESERVQAGLEVEDVEKAHQEALKAILDAKGRVTRSELKQHAAGQFNAILNFEVGHDAAGPMRDRLRQLGTMVRLQVDRVQQTEDGGPAPKDGKIQRGPTLFLVSIYNLANVAPRETVILRLAAADVSAVFNKLRGVIAVAKGHVINAQLDEKDRKNITAQLDFHVSRLGEGEVLAALLGAGETLMRQVNRIPENDNVTDAKVLYRIALVDADSIQPRETVVARIAAAGVPAAYQKLREALAKVKARVFTAQLNEQDRRKVTAQLDFTLRRGDEAALQAAMTGAGETLSRQATRLPESPNLTDARVLFQVTLFDMDAVQPRETVTMKIAAADVPAAYEKLRAAVAKGHILMAQINEQDRRNITAQLDVTISREGAKALEAALAGAGETLSRQVTRAAEAANVTDARVLFQVTLFDVDAVQPRETVTVKIAATDVPASYEKLRGAVAAAKGRIITAQINEQDRRNITAQLDVTMNRSDVKVLEAALAGAGETLSRQATRAAEAANVTDTKVHAVIELMPAAAIAPRETTTLAMEVADVAATLKVSSADVKEAQGRTVETQIGQERDGQVSARVVFDVPLNAATALAEKFKTFGKVRVDRVTRDPQAPEGKLAIGRLVITLSNTPLLLPSDQGLWSQLRGGLAFSLRGLSISASWLIVGLLFVLPWLLVVYAAVWLTRRLWRGESADAAVPAASAGNVPPASNP